ARTYPDWYLFRRGQTHTEIDADMAGGRSELEPMVVAAYGPLADGRAIMAPGGTNPFGVGPAGEPAVWYHVVLNGLDMRRGYSMVQGPSTDSLGGGPITLAIEDCAWRDDTPGKLTYLPK